MQAEHLKTQREGKERLLNYSTEFYLSGQLSKTLSLEYCKMWAEHAGQTTSGIAPHAFHFSVCQLTFRSFLVPSNPAVNATSSFPVIQLLPAGYLLSMGHKLKHPNTLVTFPFYPPDYKVCMTSHSRTPMSHGSSKNTVLAIIAFLKNLQRLDDVCGIKFQPLSQNSS